MERHFLPFILFQFLIITRKMSQAGPLLFLSPNTCSSLLFEKREQDFSWELPAGNSSAARIQHQYFKCQLMLPLPLCPGSGSGCFCFCFYFSHFVIEIYTKLCFQIQGMGPWTHEWLKSRELDQKPPATWEHREGPEVGKPGGRASTCPLAEVGTLLLNYHIMFLTVEFCPVFFPPLIWKADIEQPIESGCLKSLEPKSPSLAVPETAP